jgi:hypothetical protein
VFGYYKLLDYFLFFLFILLYLELYFYHFCLDNYPCLLSWHVIVDIKRESENTIEIVFFKILIFLKIIFLCFYIILTYK